MGRAGGAFLHAAMGRRSPVDATVVGAAESARQQAPRICLRLTAGQLHGNVVYRFGGADARLQPFAFAGLGATFFRSDDVPSETKFSLGFGGGVKYFLSRSLACAGTSATNRTCSTTRRRATSVFRSDSVRERCSRSSSPPARCCVSSLPERRRPALRRHISISACFCGLCGQRIRPPGSAPPFRGSHPHGCRGARDLRPRVHVLTAQTAAPAPPPIGAVLREMPSDLWHFISWDTGAVLGIGGAAALVGHIGMTICPGGRNQRQSQ